MQAQTKPGTVWIEIDVEDAMANGHYLSPRDYREKGRAGEPIWRVIPGCEGGVKHQVPESHWVRVEMITKGRVWKTLHSERWQETD